MPDPPDLFPTPRIWWYQLTWRLLDDLGAADRSVIGTASLRGNPMDLLERSAQLTWFPSLWAVRDGLFVDFKAGDLDV